MKTYVFRPFVVFGLLCSLILCGLESRLQLEVSATSSSKGTKKTEDEYEKEERELEQRRQDMLDEIKSIKSDISTVEDKIKELKTARSDLQTYISQLDQQVNSIASQIKELETEIKLKKEEIAQKEMDHKIDHIQVPPFLAPFFESLDKRERSVWISLSDSLSWSI